MARGIKRRDVIQAVQIAARDAAKTSTNPIYVEALELAVRALEDNDWTMPHRRTEQIRGGPSSTNHYPTDEYADAVDEEDD